MSTGKAFPVSTGGPAFPLVTDLDVQWQGMFLRDYFAAKAMQAIFAGEGARMVANRDGRYNEDNWAVVVALNSYEMADAMLAERAKAK